MSEVRMKIVGAGLGLVAFGGLLGAVFTGYGGFASAATPGTGYASSPAAVTMQANSGDKTTPADKNSTNSDLTSKEDMVHYATLFEQNLAAQLGISTDKLESDARAALGTTIDQAVADGKIDATMAATLKGKIGNLDFRDLLSVPFGMSGKIDGKDALGDSQAFMDATNKAFDAGAQLLGISRDEFDKSLRDNSLAATMTAKNVTVETLLNTLTTTLRTELDKAVTSGALTQADSDLMYNAFKG
ncbi:MAG: hypothetical protein ABIQ44_10555, partial [Chloroflexia bacterium]